jgi:hypothetical protein
MIIIDVLRHVNAGIEFNPDSARSGDGLGAWYSWLRRVATKAVFLKSPIPGV